MSRGAPHAQAARWWPSAFSRWCHLQDGIQPLCFGFVLVSATASETHGSHNPPKLNKPNKITPKPSPNLSQTLLGASGVFWVPGGFNGHRFATTKRRMRDTVRIRIRQRCLAFGRSAPFGPPTSLSSGHIRILDFSFDCGTMSRNGIIIGLLGRF